jgi:hypothetical protein
MLVEQGLRTDGDKSLGKALPLVAMYFWMHQFFYL